MKGHLKNATKRVSHFDMTGTITLGLYLAYIYYV